MIAGARGVVAALVAVGLAVSGAAASAAADERPIVLTKGHIDLFEVTYDPATEALQLQVKDDSELYGEGTQYHDPADVVIAVDEELAKLVIPEGFPESFAFLGEPGDVVYDLPETQNSDLPWPGWSTERLPASLPEGITLPAENAVELAIEIEGPGEVFTFMNNPFGEPINRYIDTTDPVPDVIPVGSRSHVHTEWVFTELGSYTLTVTPTATTTGGETITGPAEEYQVRIGDEAASEKAKTKVEATLKPERVKVGKRAQLDIVVDVLRSAQPARGKVVVRDGRRKLLERTLSPRGRVSVKLPVLGKGSHRITVRYLGNDQVEAAVSKPQTLVVRKP